MENQKKNITNLVLSGGGIKGIAMLGALKALEKNKMLENISSISATSVGSLIGALYIMGYSIDDLYEFLSIIDISKMKSLKAGNLLCQFGLDDGKKIIIVIEKMLVAKNFSPDITLLEFYKKTNVVLHITGSCVNDKKLYYFSHVTYPNMQLKLAIRISTSVPLWFIPVEYEGKLFVDGACMENYPIKIFDADLDKTIGIHLSSDKPYVNEIDNLELFLINLIHCFEEGLKIKAICGYEKNTIQINTSNIQTFNLDISNDQKQEIFNIGHQIAIDYLNKLQVINNNI